MIAQLILGLLLACSLLGQTRVELTKQVKGELPPAKGGTGVSSCLENEGLVWQSGEFACSALASGSHAPTHQHGGADEVGSAIPAANEIPKAGAGGALAEGWLPAAVSQDMDGRARVQIPKWRPGEHGLRLVPGPGRNARRWFKQRHPDALSLGCLRDEYQPPPLH